MARKTVPQTCLNCETKFLTTKYQVDLGGGKFCTTHCHTMWRRKNPKPPRTNCSCAWCNKEIFRKPSSPAKTNFRFCSRKCLGLAMRCRLGFEEMIPAHFDTAKGPSLEEPTPDRQIRARRDHRDNVIASGRLWVCEDCGYSQHKEVLHVHHIDRNRQNNELDNLKILCPTCHCVDHFLAQDGPFQFLRQQNRGGESRTHE